MLDPFSRGAIVVMSALCVATAVALSPLRARSSTGAPPPIVFPASAADTAVGAGAIAVARDPFSGGPTARQQPPTTASPVERHSAFASADALGSLPSNLSASEIPALPGDPAHGADALGSTLPSPTVALPQVSAVVTGTHPYALLDFGGNHQIAGLGDRVAGRPIVAIDIDGVTLRGGLRLSVAPGELPR